MRTGGKAAGIAQLASTASTAGPSERRTVAPCRRSVATTCTGIAASRRSRYGRWRSRSVRSPQGSTIARRRAKKPARLRHVMGNTSERRSPRHRASRRSTPAASGAPAKYAPLIAPAEEPTTKSGRTPWATRPRSIPAWTAPKLPPPAKTNAVAIEASLVGDGDSMDGLRRPFRSPSSLRPRRLGDGQGDFFRRAAVHRVPTPTTHREPMSDDPSAGTPFGAPGIAPRWTSSSKEGIGTACSDASRVWFTLSHGILNEVYYPTVDRPQVRDLQLLLTDGETFCHEEKRDLAAEIEPLEEASLGFRITARDP